MKIIKNNLKDNTATTKITCDNCGSVLEVGEDEFEIGEFGLKGVKCGACGEMTYADDSITLTASNVSYPQHFSILTPEKCKAMSDSEINKYIGEALRMIGKDTDYSAMASGDTMVFAYKADEESSEVGVIVCKNYAETYVQIPREKF